MTRRDFAAYVKDLDAAGERVACTSRSFVRVEHVSHRALAHRAHQCARYLSAQGVGRGAKVMVVAPNSPAWIELFLGCELLGAVLVSVDATAAPSTVQDFIDRTGPRLLFLSRYGVPVVTNVARAHLEDLDALIAGYEDAPLEPGPEAMGSWPGVIVFTSGTTADPKGVVLSQGNVLANIEGILARVEVTEDWRMLSILPLSHMYGLTSELSLLVRGASVCYLERVTPAAVSDALVGYRITTLVTIPQMLTLMLEQVQRTARDEGKGHLLDLLFRVARPLPRWARRVLFRSVLFRLGGDLDVVVTGGAPIPPAIAAAWETIGLHLVQGYGLTETSPILTCNSLTRYRLDSPGWALDNMEVRVGDEGEIQARGPGVFQEYWHNPTATRAAFTEDGWFRTGDVGSVAEGWLKIEGRLKFAIVRSNGLKVFPEDVEVVADEETRLREVCVVGVSDESGERVAAVVLGDTPDDDVERAVATINAQLASFQHIDEWRRWPEHDFPRTRLMKVDRRAVWDWANAAASAPHPRAAPAGDGALDAVVQAIRHTLENDAFVVRDEERLADLGLDSLLRLAVVASVEEQTGVAIPDDAVGATTTVAHLRELARSGAPAEKPWHPPAWPFFAVVRHVGDAARDHLIFPVIRHWVDLRVEGASNLEALRGPALFIFNHSDDFDGPVVYQALPRRVRRHLCVAMGADVMADHKVLAFVARLGYAAIPFARREPYLGSLRYVSTMVDRGWHVLIAPEGHLSVDGELQPFKNGIGLLAVNLGVPVVPLKTHGLSGTVPLHAKWPRRHSAVTVRIGAPVRFGPSEDYDEVTAALRRTVDAL